MVVLVLLAAGIRCIAVDWVFRLDDIRVVVTLEQGLERGLKWAGDSSGRDGRLVLPASPQSILILGLGAKSARLNRRYHRFGRVGVREARQVQRRQAAVVTAAAAEGIATTAASIIVVRFVVADEAKVCQRLADKLGSEVNLAKLVVVGGQLGEDSLLVLLVFWVQKTRGVKMPDVPKTLGF